MNKSKIEIILNILTHVAEGTMPPHKGLKLWPSFDPETDPLIAVWWHEFSHFVSDDDVRAKDKKYDAYQRILLKSGADKIRETYSKNEIKK